MRRRAALPTFAAVMAGLTLPACGPAGRVAGSGRPWPEPGHVLRVTFLLGRLPPLGEARTETWLEIGDDRKIERSRSRTHDAAGRLEIESYAVAASRKSYHVQYLPTPRRFETATGPRAGEPVMWTATSLQRQLLGRGFRAAGRVAVAGIEGTAYERREPLHPDHPTESELALISVPRASLRASVARVYVGHEPFGIDLGEEAGYEDDSGHLHRVFYRELVVHDLLPPSEVPADVFDWPHGTD